MNELFDIYFAGTIVTVVVITMIQALSILIFGV